MSDPVLSGPHLFLASILAWLGYADQAIAHIEVGIEESETIGSLSSDAECLAMAVRSLLFLLDPVDLLPRIEKLQELTRDHVVSQLGAEAMIFKGHAIARSGDAAVGRAILSEGLAAREATEAVQRTCWLRALLAEAHQMVGETEVALGILTEELAKTAQTGELWYVAELHRRIGEVHRQCARNETARQAFEQALAVARQQSARLWELQAATSYARLLRDEGKPAPAHALLAPVYAWFTEGFDTVPLRTARAMLDELEIVPEPAVAALPLRPQGRRGSG
jgi:predicted ATPase